MVSTQKRNPELVDLLTPDFVTRNEVNYSAARIMSAFSGIAGLRGFWPMNTFGGNGDPHDMSGQLRTLLKNGNPSFQINEQFFTYASFDGSGDYFEAADASGFDITGTETYIGSSEKGLTMGGWFNTREVAPANNRGIMTKWNSDGVNQRSYYLLMFNGASKYNFLLSGDGTTWASVQSSVVLSIDTWYFVVCRYKPSTEISICINGTANENVNTTSIPASIFNSTASFIIGATSLGLASSQWNGRASMCFLSCMYLDDYWVDYLFNVSRIAFGI